MARERLVLTEIRRRYVDGGRPLPASLQRQLEGDGRAGARAILAAIARRRKKNRAEGQRLRKILRYERELWAGGMELVAGVDEAGMSPLAGPVVAAAVVLPVEHRIERVDDSKKLDAALRDELAARIKAEAVAWGVGMAQPEEIDRINIYYAGLLAMRRAVEALAKPPQHLLVDARRIDWPCPQTRIVKGDAKSLSIAAASIVAKTTRDALMVEMDARYPGYGFAKHKGYPVAQHQRAIR
ncbi:MAG TPA: ribonuclease HII [Sandaracinaceae bacterium LLY-WYZ-13_1]|nr:ribonuclease HII [Sandaracinaceae bacterium LLY-WYZ-13_1]